MGNDCVSIAFWSADFRRLGKVRYLLIKVPTLLKENEKIGGELGYWRKICIDSTQLESGFRRKSRENEKTVGTIS